MTPIQIKTTTNYILIVSYSRTASASILKKYKATPANLTKAQAYADKLVKAGTHVFLKESNNASDPNRFQ